MMNDTQKRLSASAWSMLESLSQLRRSLRKELDFLQSVSPGISPHLHEQALVSVDDFSAEVSAFLADLKYGDDDLEVQFEELSERFSMLSDRIGQLLGR